MDYLEVNMTTGEQTLIAVPDSEAAEILAASVQIALAEAMQNIRERRDELLRKSDASVLPDRWAAMPTETQTDWAVYRQALRDLPATTADALNPVWPTKP